MKLKLFTKFVILLTLLAVIPAAIVGLRTIRINQEGMQAAILELHTHLASSLAEDVQSNLKNLDREIQYILKTLSTQMSWIDRQSVLQALLDTNENFVSISIVDRQGRELLKAYNPALDKDPRLLDWSGDATFAAFWKDPKSSALSPLSFSGDEPRLSVIYPLGERHCLHATITLRSLWDRITRTKLASTGYAFLVNEKGEIIAHPDAARARSLTPATDLPIVQQVMKAVTVGSSEYVHPVSRKKIVGAYAPVKSLTWGVVIQQDKGEAYLSVYRMQRQAALLILISIVVATLLALSIARGLTNPIVKITEAARHIAKKDFSPRVKVTTRDELQDLAETFNEMTTELGRYNQMQVDKIVEEKTKTEAVIFSIADGIVMTDREAKLQVANKQAKEILGLPGDGWQGRPIFELLADGPFKEVFAEIIAHPGEDIGREVDLSSGDLLRFYLLRTEEVVAPQSGEKIGLVTVLRNITLEKELSRMKDDFLHSITHDLRNPMTSIRGFLKFLMDGVAGPVTPQQRNMLNIMDRASLKLLVLINDILDIAKLESGRMNVNLTETDLKGVVQRSIEILEGIALKKAIQISIDVPDALPKIMCDPELLERVFANLVSNAVKFTPENGRIVVRLRKEGETIEASVNDTGEGIPPEYVERIFDKFQQVAGQRKGGTGLGLTICKYIVEAHHGTIRAESKLGEGSSFIFTLPCHLTINDVIIQTAEEKKAPPDHA